MGTNYRGNTLITTLLLLFLFSSVFLVVIEDYKLTQQFYSESNDYYIAKMMVSIFMMSNTENNKTGQLSFSTGSLYYSYQENTYFIEVLINNKKYSFQEKERTRISTNQ